MINKETLKEIINDLIEVYSEKENIDFKIIFSEACSYHRGMLAQENKKKFYKSETQVPMTEPQRKFIKINEKQLRKLGFKIDNIQSKSDAFKIIKEFKENEPNN
ncbi:MAG TPA: hypothetical protein VMZ91_05165 [Candidatus Paceibacterota bacterium]|nr:hypothetical protein [Candidatus Paceibacterota bacterium]